jgi:hypothetical protein
VAFGLVVVASLGFPGLAAFEARSTLVNAATDGPFAVLVLLGTLAPVAYYARLLSVGLSRPDGALDRASWRPRLARVNLTAPREWWRTTWEANRVFSSALVAALLGLLALSAAGGAFGVSEAAAGAAPSGPVPTASAIPLPSGEPSFAPIPTE